MVNTVLQLIAFLKLNEVNLTISYVINKRVKKRQVLSKVFFPF